MYGHYDKIAIKNITENLAERKKVSNFALAKGQQPLATA
jgi:hypothetical protein